MGRSLRRIWGGYEAVMGRLWGGYGAVMGRSLHSVLSAAAMLVCP